MKKLLIVGAGIEQVPAIQISKEMGHSVIVCDMNLKAPGVRYADKAYGISTTDIDENIKIAETENIDGILTVSSETAVPTVARVADKLGLPSYSIDTAMKATNKELMRQVLLDNQVRVAPFNIARSLEELFNFTNDTPGPWVLKPTDSSGQRGTFVIDTKEKLENAFHSSLSYSKSRAVLVDKYIRGPEIHVAMQVIDGKINFLALSDRITLNEKYFGIAIRHIGPSVLSSETDHHIKEMCRKSVEAIGLKNGVATCELILDNGEAFLMEVAIRTPGGYLREVAMYLSGIDVIKSTIWNAMGENRSVEEMRTEEVYQAISVKFISALNLDNSIKKIKSIKNVDKVLRMSGIKECRFHFEVPFKVPDLISSVGRFAGIIGVGNNREVVKNLTEDAFNMIRINDMPLLEYREYNKYNFEYN